MIGTASDIQKHFPYATIRVVMAAAAKLQTQGDLIFVSELKKPAIAPPPSSLF
jgi:hypothetical protein